MTVTLVPLAIHVEIDPASLPERPCSHVNVMRDFVPSRHGPKSTLSQAFEPSGIKQAVQVGSACRIRVEAVGLLGHNMAGAFVYVGVARNGVMLEDDATISSDRIAGELDVGALAVDITDPISSAGAYEYELYFRQSSSAAGSIGYIGRRGKDLDGAVKTSISLTVLDP